jgi:flavodoxin
MKQRKSIFSCLFWAALILTVFVTACNGSGAAAESDSPPPHPKILVAYFSQTGNTQKIAIQIHEQVGGDMFRIETSIPYPDDMASLAKRKNQELASGNMPELKATVKNIESYDVVFLGYPIWAMTTPTPVRSFLENHDLTGETIVPFCTHDGYGPGSSVNSIKGLLPRDTKVLDVFDIKGSKADGAERLIASWLKKIGII